MKIYIELIMLLHYCVSFLLQLNSFFHAKLAFTFENCTKHKRIY